MNLRSFNQLGATCVLLLVATRSVQAEWANNYALFGNDSLTFLGFANVSGGPAGSNGNVYHQGGTGQFDSLRGGGALNPTPPTLWTARQNVTGNVIFNNSVTINALSNIGGSIHSGGNVTVGGNSIGRGVGGSIVSTGAVTVESYNTIGGSIVAGDDLTVVHGCPIAGAIGSNGSVSLGISTTVAGSVTYAGNFTIGAFSSVGGQTVGSVSPSPLSFSSVSLPPATTFSSGGGNLTLAATASQTLAPGSYGTLTLNGANSLYVTGGDYYFDSIVSPGTFLNLYLDLTQGPINFFVSGDAEFKRINPYVNGSDYTAVSPSLASSVYFESHGDVTMSGRFFGTLYAPYGDLTTGAIGTIIGSAIAGHDLTIGSATSVVDGTTSFVSSAKLAVAVPEPSTLVLACVAPIVCAGSYLLRKRRTSRRSDDGRDESQRTRDGRVSAQSL